MFLPLMSSSDSSIGIIAIVGLFAVAISLLLKKIHQPYLIGYIIMGVCLGEHGFDLFEDESQVEFIGELGIILLFFFIGMEISLPEFLKQWRVALMGTLAQISISVCVMIGTGYLLGWDTARAIVIGFVIALSSSAIVIKLLEEKNLLDTRVGKNVLSILLTQDIAIAPILIITAFLGGEEESTSTIILKVFGGVIIMLALIYLYYKKTIHMPFTKEQKQDHEVQVFLAVFLCFGGALLAGIFGLSPALGAFVGGMIIHASKETKWIHKSLHSFRILFVAIFFISVGAQIDLLFLWDNLMPISLVLLFVFFTNHLINMFILKFFHCTWKEAILGGALMAQIGEMSFLVCSSAFKGQIIGDYGYDFTIALISLTLLISPFWILISEKFIGRMKSEVGGIVDGG